MEGRWVRVLLTGATGFIGSTVHARLHSDGIEVVGVTRRLTAAARRLPASHWVELDLSQATSPEAWRPHLAGVYAVINCAGVLQDSTRDSTAGVHRDGPAALFAACEAAGVRRIIHLSAMGADKQSLSSFSASKRQGDEALTARDLDWVILRPSVVVGRPAYGGSALFRGLAALPVLPRLQGAGELQIVQLDDVVATIRFFLDTEAPSRVALEIAGPERLSFDQVVAAYRGWLGFPPARSAPGAGLLMGLMYRLGDLAGALGWRPPIRSNARREMVRGAVGDIEPWVRLTGISPRPLAAALEAEPASVQERWFARLYLLKALVFGVFSLFWIATGLISLGPGYQIGKAMMLEGGAGPLSGPSVVAGALADLAIGAGIAWRRTTRPALWAAVFISLFYAAAGTLLLPRLWADPLGPMLKIWPILALNMVALAILDDR
jgi:uncharacterized protein YbjT (DUF2867 family)